jgi:hypothetical protein
LWTERIGESSCFAECLYRSQCDPSCLTIHCGIRPFLITFMSQHDTIQGHIGRFTKSCGKYMDKSGDTSFRKLRLIVKVKLPMCIKIFWVTYQIIGLLKSFQLVQECSILIRMKVVSILVNQLGKIEGRLSISKCCISAINGWSKVKCHIYNFQRRPSKLEKSY